jgi:hypothetical protein
MYPLCQRYADTRIERWLGFCFLLVRYFPWTFRLVLVMGTPLVEPWSKRLQKRPNQQSGACIPLDPQANTLRTHRARGGGLVGRSSQFSARSYCNFAYSRLILRFDRLAKIA